MEAHPSTPASGPVVAQAGAGSPPDPEPYLASSDSPSATGVAVGNLDVGIEPDEADIEADEQDADLAFGSTPEEDDPLESALPKPDDRAASPQE